MSIRRFTIGVACAALTVLSAATMPAAAQDPNPLDPIVHRADRYIPKPAGTREQLHFWFGPYVVPAGHDMNRIDVDLPLANGMITQIAPGVRMAETLKEPSHQDHAHPPRALVRRRPGNKEDNSSAATPSGSSATATRRPRPTSSSARTPTRTARSTASSSAPAGRRR